MFNVLVMVKYEIVIIALCKGNAIYLCPSKWIKAVSVVVFV